MNTLKEYGIYIKKELTQPKRAGKQPRPVWVAICHPIVKRKYRQLFRNCGGHEYKGEYSFWQDPTKELLEQIENWTWADAMNTELERKERKAEHLEKRALKQKEESQELIKRAIEFIEHIPIGQPILIGHHSERRHRRDLQRSDSYMRKGIGLERKAEFNELRASNLKDDIEYRKTVKYIQNRIKECKKNIREIEKNIKANLYKKEHLWYFEGALKVYREALEYYQKILKEIINDN